VSTWLMSPGINTTRLDELQTMFAVDDKVASEM
jgi:hypothetical protein